MDVRGVDILSPDVYVKGVPNDLFSVLRKEAPVFWHEEPNGPGFWAVMKYQDVVAVSRDPQTFSSQARGTHITDLPAGDPRVSPDLLSNMDPPKHTTYRAIVGQSFTNAGLAHLEGYVRGLVCELLDELLDRDTFEFMGDFAAKLPMAIILRMVGVPSEDESELKSWIMQILAQDDPEFASTHEEVAASARRFMEYAHALAAERQRAPRDDLLSRLMAADVNGVRLTFSEFGMFFILLLAAGTHTTHLHLGNGTIALLEHPNQRARLLKNPDLILTAIEEMLRYAPPIMHTRRTATRDTEIQGRSVRTGQKVVLWYTSANRDEDVFVNSNMFDVGRTLKEHVVFGYGPHFCLGNALARMTGRIAFSECLRRMPNMELAGRPERLRSNWFNGLKRMPVAVGARS